VNPEPRHEGDYADRHVEAARRVLVDVAQVLASFHDAMVVVGGWVPDLLFHDSTDDAERAMHARRAFELVQKLLSLL
jgi:hypothetical protein